MFFKKHNTYIKKITLQKSKFLLINQHICQQYDKNIGIKRCFKTFYLWSLFAIILGIFVGKGDLKSTQIFLDCVKFNYLPQISILQDHQIVTINIKIDEKELYGNKNIKIGA